MAHVNAPDAPIEVRQHAAHLELFHSLFHFLLHLLVQQCLPALLQHLSQLLTPHVARCHITLHKILHDVQLHHAILQIIVRRVRVHVVELTFREVIPDVEALVVVRTIFEIDENYRLILYIIK